MGEEGALAVPIAQEEPGTMPSVSISPSPYRADIDGLRAVAIASVLLFHAFPRLLPGGFVGVDVFFVISGFLITRILLNQSRISIREFYRRRVKRIFPALAVVLATVLLLGWGLLLPSEYRRLGKYTLSSGLFSSNLVSWRDAGYFDAASDSQPLLHLWSLGVEEQYYLAWPLFVALLRNRRNFALTVALSAVASFVVCAWLTINRPAAAFYLPTSRFWELAVGGCVAIWSTQAGAGTARREGAGTARREGAAWLGGCLLLTSFVLISDQRPFPGAWAILPTIGTALLIACGPGTMLARVLRTRVLVAIGLISYPLYLWHWPLFSYGYILVGRTLSAGVRALLCAVSIALAAGTYHLVEKRVRAGRARWTQPGFLIAVIVAISTAGGITVAAHGFPERTPAGAEAIARTEPLPKFGCPPTLQGAGIASLDYCRLSGDGSPPLAALLGDSHADYLFDALADSRAPWLLLGNSSCPPLAGVRIEGNQKGCVDKFQRILDYLRSPLSSSIRSVFVTFYSGYALTTSYAAGHLVNHDGPDSFLIDGEGGLVQKEALFEEGLEAYLQALLATGRHVILVEDVPEFPFFPSRCASRPPLGRRVRGFLGGAIACSLERSKVERRQSWYLAMTTRLARRHPQIVLIHTLDYVCTRTECPVLDPQGELLYVDSHHVSLAAGRLVAPAIVARALGPTQLVRQVN
jgi:peptidoglycan/LPS O-acetylase OafA/YrhL